MTTKEELLKAFEIIRTGGNGFKASEEEFDEAERLLDEYIKSTADVIDVLKKNLEFETVTLYDCEDGGDVYYNRVYLNVNEKDRDGFYTLVKFGKKENLIDEKKMWW